NDSPADDFVDVEFEQVVPPDEKSIVAEDDEYSYYDDEEEEEEEEESLLTGVYGESKSLIDLSFETADVKEFEKVRVPFCQDDEYIDGKLAFMVELEGQSYGIAVPFDDTVALVMQETVDVNDPAVAKDGADIPPGGLVTHNISPDSYGTNEEYAELMEIFAVKVQEQFGEKYMLRKTPRVLTISGGLDKITKNWDKHVLSQPVSIDQLMETMEDKDEATLDQEVEEFYEFMRKELGEEEFENTMNMDLSGISEEDMKILEFFENPGVGSKKDDLKGLEELSKTMSTDLQQGEVPEAKQFQPDLENAALKLLGYTFTETGKSYFLVKPFQPMVLVGRHMKEEKDCVRFQLLTPEEEAEIIPKLEALCEEEMKAKGLTFQQTDNSAEEQRR
ncbi:MAG: hypothetical protein SGILL_004955, partial [Bacillariaceae sp.]